MLRHQKTVDRNLEEPQKSIGLNSVDLSDFSVMPLDPLHYVDIHLSRDFKKF